MAELNEYVDENSKSLTNDAALENLKHESENYIQELYDLRRKFQILEATQKDVEENNEKLEQLVKEKSEQIDKLKHSIKETQREYSNEKLEYTKTVSMFEANLNDKCKEIEKLKQLLEKKKPETTLCLFDESKNVLLENEIEDLKRRLADEQKYKEEYITLYKDVQNQNLELENILQITKSSLCETKELLASARDELAISRNQLEMAKITPTDANNKGNSLFAEVEDKRKELVNKITALQTKYQEMKKIDAMRVNEIKVLKTEKAVLMRKWETDTSYLLEDHDNLLEKYQQKVTQLSKELDSVKKKNQQGNLVQSDRYLESLLMDKQEEINALQSKIQGESIHKLMLEDKKLEITKQCRYWKYKAMSLEAQILQAKNKFESELLDTSECQTIFDDLVNQTQINKIDFDEGTGNLMKSSDDCSVKSRDAMVEAMLQEHLEKPTNDFSKNDSNKTGILKMTSNPYNQKVQKTLQFSKDTKYPSTGSSELEKLKKNYPTVYISTKQNN